jgi:hypothetical protein
MDPSAAVRAAPTAAYSSVFASAGDTPLTDREVVGLVLLFAVGVAIVLAACAAFGRLGAVMARATAVAEVPSSRGAPLGEPLHPAARGSDAGPDPWGAA